MTYIQELRGRAGDLPLMLVRPTLILANDCNEILLVQYRNGSWGLPGGLMEPGETAEETIIREIKEELNVAIEKPALLTVLSGGKYYKKSRNGYETYYVSPVYVSKHFAGTLQADQEEVIDYGFYGLDDMPRFVTEIDREVLRQYMTMMK